MGWYDATSLGFWFLVVHGKWQSFFGRDRSLVILHSVTGLVCYVWGKRFEGGEIHKVNCRFYKKLEV